MSALPLRKIVLRLSETLVYAVAGGVALGLTGFPAGWLSGAMLCVAIAALAGRPMGVPMPLARIVYVAIGIWLGAVVTPETLRGVTAWPLSILMLALAIVAMTTATAVYLRVVHGWDRLSALFAATPGALSQVMIMASEMGADLRAVAIVQSIRIAILTIGVPSGLALFGITGTPVMRGGSFANQSLGQLAVLIAVCVAAALGLDRLRFPGGLMFGAMTASAVLHGGGFVDAGIPAAVINAGMIALGAIIGSRFSNTGFRILLSFIGAGLGSFVVAAAVAFCFVSLLLAALPLRTVDAIIAFAPGALDVMMILALALHLDPVYVGAHHLARFLLVSVSLPLVVRLVAGKKEERTEVAMRSGPTPPQGE